jgi:hypothetical protein
LYFNMFCESRGSAIVQWTLERSSLMVIVYLIVIFEWSDERMDEWKLLTVLKGTKEAR